jgi:hypothetical protein
MINISSWGNSSEQAVKEFEQQIGFTLPADYRQFLINNNGAWVNNQKFFVKDLGQEILMHVLYGLTNSESKGLTLGYWLAKHDGDIDDKELVIGHDQGGHQILLVTDGEGKGVYYWDHNNFFPQSADGGGNAYFVADDFTAFCQMLHDE